MVAPFCVDYEDMRSGHSALMLITGDTSEQVCMGTYKTIPGSNLHGRATEIFNHNAFNEIRFKPG